MSDFAAGQGLLFAGAMFAGSVLLMVLARLAAFAGRASLRHLIWAAAFGALLALPALALAVPGAIVLTIAPPAQPAPPPPIALDRIVDRSALPSMSSSAMPPSTPSRSLPAAVAFDLGDVARLLIGLWFAGVVLIGLRHLIAAFLLRNMLRDSTPHPFEPSELAMAPRGLRFDLRLSPRGQGPLTWGIFRPVILLPEQAQFWPQERLEAVLRHEFAHVRRRDGLAQALALAASALYWPNPLVWLGLRALRHEAEVAADDAVIASGMTPSDYAGELLHMAKEFRAQGLSAALAMAAPSALPARVKSILAPTQTRSGVTSMDVLKMTAIALLTAGALVAARPSLAQDAPPAPPTLATPATPPTPMMEVTPPVPPQEAVAPTPPDAADGHHVVRIVRLHGAHTDRDVRRMRIEIQRANREVHDAMARVKPEIDRAMAQARRARSLRPEINAQIKKALAEARAQLALVHDDAIRAKVDAALARAEARIDQAAASGEGDDGDRTVILQDDSDSH
jgi:beta-lactamase regulating signal transducer with metallopeptidase domain